MIMIFIWHGPLSVIIMYGVILISNLLFQSITSLWTSPFTMKGAQPEFFLFDLILFSWSLMVMWINLVFLDPYLWVKWEGGRERELCLFPGSLRALLQPHLMFFSFIGKFACHLHLYTLAKSHHIVLVVCFLSVCHCLQIIVVYWNTLCTSTFESISLYLQHDIEHLLINKPEIQGYGLLHILPPRTL